MRKLLLLDVMAVAVLLALTGCTTLSLKRHVISQSESASDLRYREVMENLAMIYQNPATLPAYCSIYYGTTDITDTVPVSSTTTWTRTLTGVGAPFTRFSGQSLDFNTSRTIKKNWALDPTVVPEKLYAMRCACWWALFGVGNQFGDCLTLEQYNEKFPPGAYFAVADRLRSLPPGWLRAGCRGDVPRCVAYKAECRGKFVWVEPVGMEGLSQFTIVMQEIARDNSDSVMYPKPQTKSVELKFPQCGPNGEEKMTVYVDPNGFVTPGDGLGVLPRKIRNDNVAAGNDLKSSLSAATK
jgi:hypothetical protein